MPDIYGELNEYLTIKLFYDNVELFVFERIKNENKSITTRRPLYTSGSDALSFLVPSYLFTFDTR